MKTFKALQTQPEKPLRGMRLATEFDFRSPEGLFICNLEYYEYMIGSRVFEMQITDEDTNRDWLKSKIAFGFIQVPIRPVYWNQRSSL